MATMPPIAIPWPLSSSPGASVEESNGRLINVHSEPLGDGSPAWHRCPGLTRFATTARAGYRGGLIVNNLSFEVWDDAATVDVNGNVTLLGAIPGNRNVSIARNQLAGTPNTVIVDPDNGAFDVTGGIAPAAYNGGGNLPQPNSISFFDSFFLFTIADGRIFASGVNALTQNALTFETCQAKSSVTLLRGIPFGGLFFAFTTASCEVFQDTAQPDPNFPFTRLVVLEYGLIQSAAICGFEDGFSSLIWVAQDFGAYQLVPGSLAPTKVSPPDLDRLIEAQVRLGNQLQAGCYAFAGKKFWTLSSPAWTWEFNLNTGKWHERWSLQATGLFGRWRGSGGHPAFGKWLIGDALSGNLLAVDDSNFTEDGAVQLCRMESGPVSDFPNRLRVPRADFDFVTGVGQAAANIVMSVSGTSSGTGGVVRLQVNSTTSVQANDTIIVSSVGGTVEANGTFPGTVIDSTHLELQGTKFVNAFTSGGTAIDVTSPPNVINPVVAISWSDDNGNRWKNPLIRALGQQANSKNTRIAVKNTGQSGPQARRWRWDVSDPVYTSFTGAKQSTDPKAY